MVAHPCFLSTWQDTAGGYHKYKAIVYQMVSARTAWAGDRKVLLFKRQELKLRSLHVRPQCQDWTCIRDTLS